MKRFEVLRSVHVTQVIHVWADDPGEAKKIAFAAGLRTEATEETIDSVQVLHLLECPAMFS